MERIFKISGRERKIRIIYLGALILLFICFLVTLYINRQLIKQSKHVEHTNRVINTLDHIVATMTDAETGMRGYLLSRDPHFLEPFKGKEKMADSLLERAKLLTAENPLQHQRIPDLQEMIHWRFGILNAQISTFENNNRNVNDTIINKLQLGMNVMSRLRKNISVLEAEENKVLEDREKKLNTITSLITAITIITLGLVISLLIFGLITYMQVSRQRKNAERGILAYQMELSNRIQALDEANEELKKMRSLEKFAVTGRIARTIGHEVRNPLTNIMLAADQLKIETGVSLKDSTYLFDMIDRNCARINQLIADLLDSTKVSELNMEKLSLARLLDETLQEALDRVALTNITLVKNYQSGGNGEVSVDKSKMKIALLNIITNALEAMQGKAGGKLTITTTENEDKYGIIIEDNGPGMDEETVSRIFEPYFTTKKSGNGLGLTNTQNIILNHKGEISVESKLQEGTRFKIFLKKETWK